MRRSKAEILANLKEADGEMQRIQSDIRLCIDIATAETGATKTFRAGISHAQELGRKRDDLKHETTKLVGELLKPRLRG